MYYLLFEVLEILKRLKQNKIQYSRVCVVEKIRKEVGYIVILWRKWACNFKISFKKDLTEKVTCKKQYKENFLEFISFI